jgi:hypothetical protein
MPNFEAYHRSLTDELYSIKDRIRTLVTHWGTDGEHKEVALRSVLRRHLPATVTVGRGFVVSPWGGSTQIDVMVTDASKPVLFRDGDLLIVTADAVVAVIEVKTSLGTEKEIAEALTKLSEIEETCRDTTGRDQVWTGLFVFSGEPEDQERVLRAIGTAYNHTRRPVNCVAFGKRVFVRYWIRGADVQSDERGPVWHSYDLPDVAPSYFLGNLIDSITTVDNQSAGFAWFPLIGGKEAHRNFYLPLNSLEPKRFEY